MTCAVRTRPSRTPTSRTRNGLSSNANTLAVASTLTAGWGSPMGAPGAAPGLHVAGEAPGDAFPRQNRLATYLPRLSALGVSAATCPGARARMQLHVVCTRAPVRDCRPGIVQTQQQKRRKTKTARLAKKEKRDRQRQRQRGGGGVGGKAVATTIDGVIPAAVAKEGRDTGKQASHEASNQAMKISKQAMKQASKP